MDETRDDDEPPETSIDADRLAQLIGGDDEDDDDEEVDKLRMQRLLRRGTSDVESPRSPVVTVVAVKSTPPTPPPTPEIDEPPRERTAFDLISSKLTAMRGDDGEQDDDDEELTFRGEYIGPVPAVGNDDDDNNALASLRLRVSRHEARAPTEIALDVVWENETRDGQLSESAKRFAARALGRSPVPEDRPWRPCRGDAKIWGTDLKPPYESPTSPRLGHLFTKHRRAPGTSNLEDVDQPPPSEEDQLPDMYTWRWISPWQVDGRFHGSDRMSTEDDDAAEGTTSSPDDDWLYAPHWPAPGEAYSKRCRPEHRVRCRRWVRPRERLGTHVVLDALLAAAPNRDDVAASFITNQDDRTGLVDLDAVIQDLGLASKPVPIEPPPVADRTPTPPPPPTTTKEEEESPVSSSSSPEPSASFVVSPHVSQVVEQETTTTTVDDDEDDDEAKKQTAASEVLVEAVPPPPPPPHQNRMGEMASSIRSLLERAQQSRNLSKADPSNPAEETGVVLDFVWQNQRYVPSLRGAGVWTSQALARRPPYEASRPELAELFKRHGGPPDVAADVLDNGLPDDWKWISPWLVDSVSFGADRGVTDADKLQGNNTTDGWLYAFDWPTNDRGYKPKPESKSFVRCRRWVRPRERITYTPQSSLGLDSPSVSDKKNLDSVGIRSPPDDHIIKFFT